YLGRETPVAWLFAVVGLMTVAYSIWLRPAMPRFWWFGMAILIVALLPLGDAWASFGGRHPLYQPGIGPAVGMAWFLSYALLSHRALIRLFPPPPRDAGNREAEA